VRDRAVSPKRRPRGSGRWLPHTDRPHTGRFGLGLADPMTRTGPASPAGRNSWPGCGLNALMRRPHSKLKPRAAGSGRSDVERASPASGASGSNSPRSRGQSSGQNGVSRARWYRTWTRPAGKQRGWDTRVTRIVGAATAIGVSVGCSAPGKRRSTRRRSPSCAAENAPGLFFRGGDCLADGATIRHHAFHVKHIWAGGAGSLHSTGWREPPSVHDT
jgi:hypothetical protein